jgi:hypothetical protein
VLLAATKPQAVQPGGRERLARLLLAFTGLTLALGPPLTMLAGAPGWSSVALMTVMPLGVLLVVLAAFYPRITGTVRFGLFSVTIGPSPVHILEAEPRERRPSSDRGTQTPTGTRVASEDGLSAMEVRRREVM